MQMDVQAFQEECEHDLKAAEPIIAEAEAALNSLDKVGATGVTESALINKSEGKMAANGAWWWAALVLSTHPSHVCTPSLPYVCAPHASPAPSCTPAGLSWRAEVLWLPCR